MSHDLIFGPILGSLAGLICVGAIVITIYKAFAGKGYILTENTFKQNGVLVDFKNKTITMNRRTYTAKDVHSISYHTQGRMFIVTLETRHDFEHPLHKFSLLGHASGEKFYSRLTSALERSGVVFK